MNNKVLYGVIAGVILVFGAFFIYRLNTGSEPQEAAQVDVGRGSGAGEQAAEKTPKAETQPVAAEIKKQECVRNVDSNKLKATNMDIKNRQAEIDVKGFGKITLEFYDKDAPKTVENFLRLADSGYYNCVSFHRVAKGFVIQGGDPTGTGAGGDSAFGGEFADEIKQDSELYKSGYKKGVLAMANRGPNTNTSQFFIMLGDVPLPPAYTIFGKVVSGLDVVDKIGQVEIVPQMGPTDGKPKEPVVMESVKIIK